MKTQQAAILERLTRLNIQVLDIQHELISLRWLFAATVEKPKKPKRKKSVR